MARNEKVEKDKSKKKWMWSSILIFFSSTIFYAQHSRIVQQFKKILRTKNVSTVQHIECFCCFKVYPQSLAFLSGNLYKWHKLSTPLQWWPEFCLGSALRFLLPLPFCLSRYFLTHLKLRPSLTIEVQIYEDQDSSCLVWFERESMCVSVTVSVLTYFFHLIYLFTDKTLDKNLFWKHFNRKIVDKFSFYRKATSTINHDYRKFPLGQDII